MDQLDEIKQMTQKYEKLISYYKSEIENLYNFMLCHYNMMENKLVNKKHEQVILNHPIYKIDIEIDKNIADLIEQLWKAGIQTTNSCENNIPNNYIWIQFVDSSHCNNFINILTKDKILNNDILSKNIFGIQECTNQWIIKLDYYLVNQSDYRFGEISVRFHKDDYYEVYSRIKQFVDLQ
jgi:hypothetical protein